MSYQLQFIVMAKDELNRDLYRMMLRACSTAVAVGTRLIRYDNNIIEFRANEFFDENLSSDSEEGYLYYPIRLEVAPESSDVQLDHQIKLAVFLRDFFRQHGVVSEVCADFEELLE